MENTNTGPRRSRAPVAAALAAVVFTLAILPISSRQLGPTQSFVPAMLAIVACFDVLSVYLLVGEYLDTGDARLLAMSWAYLWSLVLMAGYALSFPGVLASAPLATSASVAPWMYVGWHAGFPILLGVAWWPGGSSGAQATAAGPGRGRRRRAAGSATAVTLLAAAVVAIIARDVDRLPVLINGLDTHRMAVVTAPVVLPAVLIALVLAWRGAGRRRGPERWTGIAVLVSLCDLVLTYGSRYRYSAGWYCGRMLTLFGAALVAAAMLAEFRRIKRQAEQRAATDGLTGLPNRRAAEAWLAAELARAGRVGVETSVLLLDLDGFKRVNDTHGHVAGDRVLCEVGAAWSARLRLGDLLARIGGDEFLVVLPATSAAGAAVVADKLSAALPAGVGVSIGATFVPGFDAYPTVTEVIAEADKAMYLRKSRRSARIPGPRVAEVATRAGARQSSSSARP